MVGGRSRRTSQNNGGMHRGMPPSQVRIQDRQQTTAAWNAWSASAPPKNSSCRTCTPKLFAVAPGVISTVAGENGAGFLLLVSSLRELDHHLDVVQCAM